MNLNPNPHHFLTIATLIFLFLVGRISCGKTQSSTLGRLYKTKYHNGKLNQECCHNSHINSTVDWRQRVKRELKGERERDRIEKLPGQPPVKFQQYGGYVTVDKRIGRDFYYYFAEADLSKKDSLPLLLWLNGGPGCSSLGYGAMQEIGPFRVNSDGKTLFRNRFAWNHAANVLFLESPAGVGFSYSNRTTDYETAGDKRTAGDNYMFLLNWLQRFPEYKHRDLYIAGESYAGHYVPQLANVILTHNNKPYNTHHRINLKGILIGNAAINDETDLKGMYEYFWTHNLISDEVANRISKKCDFSPSATSQSSECEDATDEAEIDVQDIDIYNIYAPLCVSSNLTSKPKRPSQVIDPCSDAYVYAYLNSPQVQKALHANLTHLPYDWQPCSEVITTWGDSPTTILPVLKELLHNGLRVWIFSGDTDGRIPVTSTKMSINEMRLPIKTPWHPWYIKGEVGGYTQEYEGGLTFTTVRGAGHQVPSYQPLRALSLIFHFLGGTSLPNSSKNTFLQP